MKEFLEAVEQNPKLKEKVEALDAAGSAPAQYIALAAEYGFALTAADFAPAAAGGPVSDDELDAVAGGAQVCIMNNISYERYQYLQAHPGESERAADRAAGELALHYEVYCPNCHQLISGMSFFRDGTAVCSHCGYSGSNFLTMPM